MRNWAIGILGAVVLACAAAPPAAAQSREDSAAVWLDAARQLRLSGQPGAADALLDLLRRRFEGTAAASEAGRLLAVARSQPEPERPGRVELLVWSATYGAWLGLAVPIIAGADNPEAFGLGLLAGAPLAFLGAREYLKTHPLTEGQARAITFGGSWGSWQGFGWTEALDIGAGSDCDQFGYCYDRSPDAETLVAGTVLGGLAGIATGALMARKPITSGVATTVSFGGLWGSGYGMVAGVLLDLEDDDLLAATLIGGNVGLAAMAALAPKWNPSRNRARLVSLGGVVGALAGGGLDLIIQPDDEKVAVLIPAITATAGMLIAAASLRPGAAESGEGGSPAPERGSLLEYRKGDGLELGTPALGLKVQRDRQWQAHPALYVPVLQARF